MATATAQSRRDVKEFTYLWEGVDRNNRQVRGESRAASETVVTTNLRRQGVRKALDALPERERRVEDGHVAVVALGGGADDRDHGADTVEHDLECAEEGRDQHEADCIEAIASLLPPCFRARSRGLLQDERDQHGDRGLYWEL